ncbi:MAG TPA: fatty acid desaturase [Pyrinomonadaceae bacterium]|jgi:fatty acid desaturase
MGVPVSDYERWLKKAIRAELPADAFRKRPLRAMITLPLLLAIVGGSFAVVRFSLPWYVALIISVLLGSLYGSLFFFGHEIAHGAVIQSKRWQDFILFPAFLIFCLSPHFWRAWHNMAHHAHTNVAGYDPDNFGTIELFNGTRFARLINVFAPGSGCWPSFFFLFLFFTLHAQGVLWWNSQRIPFPQLSKRRAALETFPMIAFWIALSFTVGLKAALFVVLIPMFSANAVIMSYIVTNHLMRPLTSVQDTLSTTMSVSTPKIFDKLHFHFSHHVEHHLFPSLSTKYAPLVRASLLRHARDRYLAPSHLKSLVVLHRTPRIYDGWNTLVDPPTSRRVAIKDIEAMLQGRLEKDGLDCRPPG